MEIFDDQCAAAPFQEGPSTDTFVYSGGSEGDSSVADLDDFDLKLPADKITLVEAKALLKHLAAELETFRQQKKKLEDVCKRNRLMAEARRRAGCHVGFAFSVRRLLKTQLECDRIAKVELILETLSMLTSNQIEQAEALSDLCGQGPPMLESFFTIHGLREEIATVLADCNHVDIRGCQTRSR